MKIGLRKFAFLVVPPLMSCALLGGMVAEQATHLKPQDVEVGSPGTELEFAL